MSEPSVQILQNKVFVNPEAVAGLRAEFSETGIAALPRFLSPVVLKMLLRSAESADFRLKNEVRRATGAVFGTTRLVAESDPMITAIHFALNRLELFQLATDVCGIEKPGNFLCRVHRTEAAADQHIDWHDDAVDGRILGLNINLSADGFQGGLFQIRSPDKRVRGEVHFSEPGDAFLFRIGGGWQHRLTPVEGGLRTVAVGWFRERPDWQTMALAGFYNGKITLSEWIG